MFLRFIALINYSYLKCLTTGTIKSNVKIFSKKKPPKYFNFLSSFDLTFSSKTSQNFPYSRYRSRFKNFSFLCVINEIGSDNRISARKKQPSPTLMIRDSNWIRKLKIILPFSLQLN